MTNTLIAETRYTRKPAGVAEPEKFLPGDYLPTLNATEETFLIDNGVARKMRPEEAAVYALVQGGTVVATTDEIPVVKTETVEDDLETLTVPVLKDLAVSEQIDLGEVTKKGDIIDRIRAARSGTPDLF